jgi:hypothetical protein
MISVQSVIIAIVYILCLIVGLLTIIKQNKVSVGSIIGMLFCLGFIALLVYDTNCLTNGACGVWSWIRTILYIIFPIIGLIIALVALVKPKKEENKYIS